MPKPRQFKSEMGSFLRDLEKDPIISSKDMQEHGTHPYMKGLRQLLETGISLYPRHSSNGDFLNLESVDFNEVPELKSLQEVKGIRALVNLLHKAKDQGYIEFVNQKGEPIVIHPAEMPKRIQILKSLEESENTLNKKIREEYGK